MKMNTSKNKRPLNRGCPVDVNCKPVVRIDEHPTYSIENSDKNPTEKVRKIFLETLQQKPPTYMEILYNQNRLPPMFVDLASKYEMSMFPFAKFVKKSNTRTTLSTTAANLTADSLTTTTTSSSNSSNSMMGIINNKKGGNNNDNSAGCNNFDLKQPNQVNLNNMEEWMMKDKGILRPKVIQKVLASLDNETLTAAKQAIPQIAQELLENALKNADHNNEGKINLWDDDDDDYEGTGSDFYESISDEMADFAHCNSPAAARKSDLNDDCCNQTNKKVIGGGTGGGKKLTRSVSFWKKLKRRLSIKIDNKKGGPDGDVVPERQKKVRSLSFKFLKKKSSPNRLDSFKGDNNKNKTIR